MTIMWPLIHAVSDESKREIVTEDKERREEFVVSWYDQSEQYVNEKVQWARIVNLY